FDNSVYDATLHAEVRAREFAALDVPGLYLPLISPQIPPPASIVLAPNARVEKLADGFFSISGGAVDAEGTLYFVDTHWQKIYRWIEVNREAVLVSSDALQPENLAIDKAGDLLVVSRSGAGKVYALGTDGAMKTIEQTQAEERGGAAE